jgi:parallel beta-helix repeat protein
VDEVWHNSSDVGAVLSLTYTGNGTWYGLYYDAVSQNVTVISVSGSSPPRLIVVPDDYSTIQSAVDAATPGDTVYVRAGTYYENVQVNEALSLVGENPQDTVIDGGDVQSVIRVVADDVSVTGFTMRDDQPASKGGWDYADIALSGAGCDISGNVLTDSFAGVNLSASASYNNIIGNEIANNDWGVYIGAYNSADPSGAAANNNVIGNNITSNNVGVGDFAYDNVFYHNNFIGNARQVISGGLANVWDDGYPSGGNYWSDYTGTDSLSGPYQNQTGSDGIGDTPYIIDANNTDNYPLMGIFLALPNGVSAVSNSTISDFQNQPGSYISFDVLDPVGTTGFCTLTIPYSIANPPYTVLVDGQKLPFATVYADGAVSVIYFAYSDSTHEVTIIAWTGSGGGRVPYLD